MLQLWESCVALQLMATEPQRPAAPMRRKKQQRSTRGVEMESDVPPQPCLDPLFARLRWAPAAGAAPRSAPGCTPCCGDPPHPGLLRAAPGLVRRALPRPQGALESPVPSPVPAGACAAGPETPRGAGLAHTRYGPTAARAAPRGARHGAADRSGGALVASGSAPSTFSGSFPRWQRCFRCGF